MMIDASLTKDVIFTPPPTPNGGLHVGHIAGPYLRADINTKLRKTLGETAAHLSHIDNYQTYVAKKAIELGLETDAFRHEMIGLIDKDFQRFNIDFDLKIDNTEDSYRRFLTNCLAELFRDSHAVCRFEFIGADKRHSATEAYVSGTCPHCLQWAFANVCENCGMPLEIQQMIRPIEELTGATTFTQQDSDGVPNAISINRNDIEWIREQYRNIAIDNRFITRMLTKLSEHYVVLTLRSDYGFKISDGRVINPWVEIFFAHIYSLGRLLEVEPNGTIQDIRRALQINRNIRVSYYFGVDNSYYYCVLFLLLAKIMNLPNVIPIALKANRFLTLNHRKMSSSKNNVIWARDIAGKFPVNILRASLMASCPEYSEIDFDKGFLEDRIPLQIPLSDAQSIFNRPLTEVGKRFRLTLIELSDPRNFSIEELLNKINKVTEFFESKRATAIETEELRHMVDYLFIQLNFKVTRHY
ncbi:MAG: class I tRNA ligase family protein [Nitrospirae bacterium]|nr:class I tRNA ligase family protein [Nitrospirota bacterium]